MKSIFRCVVLGVWIFLLTLSAAEACTTFQLDRGGEIYVGKNFDYGVEDGLIMVNKRGVTKTAMPPFKPDPGTGKPAHWTSKFGSVTFNQYGREFSYGGMNEAGLVVETMMVPGNCAYPEPDSRPSINAYQWRQYQLDNFSSTEEVIRSDSVLRIRPQKGMQVHFFVTDKKGHSATIDFVEGKMVTHSGDAMPVKILTNTPYEEALSFFRQDRIPEPDRYKSIMRFVIGAKRLKEFQAGSPKNPRDFSFEVLDDLSWSETGDAWVVQTLWSIVYDLKNLHIYFKTHGNREIRWIDLHRIDFSCATPVKVLDINTDLSGDVTEEFVLYSRDINRNLAETSFNKTIFLPKMPARVFDAIADYPETFSCQD